MPKVTAYQCPSTKKVFLERSAYRKHLLKLRKNVNLQRKLRREAKQRSDELLNKITALSSIEDIAAFVVANYKKILLNAIHDPRPRDVEVIEAMVLKDFSLTVRYEQICSNSHSCPRDGVKNWGGDKPGAPRGYPGFYGRIEWKMPPPAWKRGDGIHSYELPEALGRIGIHTGTGGGNGDRYGYDVRLFLSDFPALQETVNLDVFTAKLANTTPIIAGKADIKWKQTA